jgi:hypothetical protein
LQVAEDPGLLQGEDPIVDSDTGKTMSRLYVLENFRRFKHLIRFISQVRSGLIQLSYRDCYALPTTVFDAIAVYDRYFREKESKK